MEGAVLGGSTCGLAPGIGSVLHFINHSTYTAPYIPYWRITNKTNQITETARTLSVAWYSGDASVDSNGLHYPLIRTHCVAFCPFIRGCGGADPWYSWIFQVAGKHMLKRYARIGLHGRHSRVHSLNLDILIRLFNEFILSYSGSELSWLERATNISNKQSWIINGEDHQGTAEVSISLPVQKGRIDDYGLVLRREPP